jgi:DNA-binding GntR family transcriptional regulator
MPVPDKVDVLQRTSAREQVFEIVKGWIEDGTLAPGEIVKDTELAETLGVSRTPVREAFQQLEKLGALETEPSRHTRVARVRPEDAALLYPVLAELQAVGVVAAIARATPADVAELEMHNERIRGAYLEGDAVAARQADYDFHRVVIRLAANPYLSNTIDSLQLHSRRMDALYFTHLAPSETSYQEHRAIIDAITAGDAARAADVMRANFVRSVEVIEGVKNPG